MRILTPAFLSLRLTALSEIWYLSARLYRITIGAAMCVGLNCNYSDLKEFTKKIPQLNKKLRDYYSRKMMERAGKKRTYKNDVRVLPLMRQEIDMDKLAQTLVMIAKDMKASKD